MPRKKGAKLSHLTRLLQRQNDRLQATLEKSQGAYQRAFEAIQLLEKNAMRKRRKAKRR